MNIGTKTVNTSSGRGGGRKKPRGNGRSVVHVPRSCAPCRLRKKKCDGGRPCGRCDELKDNCYDEGVDARNPANRSYPQAVNMDAYGPSDGSATQNMTGFQTGHGYADNADNSYHHQVEPASALQLYDQRYAAVGAYSAIPAEYSSASMPSQRMQLSNTGSDRSQGQNTTVAAGYAYVDQPYNNYNNQAMYTANINPQVNTDHYTGPGDPSLERDYYPVTYDEDEEEEYEVPSANWGSGH